MEKYYLAIDIGASSGRHMLSSIKDGKLVLEEIYRFENGMVEKDGHLTWDVEKLFKSILEGLKKAKEIGKIPYSVGIDTWAVDYALLDENDKLIGDVYAYRDGRASNVIDKLHAIVPQKTLYERTGIMFSNINTIYQLFDDKLTGKLDKAKTLLMVPDYFNFLLTGIKKFEYTNATTTSLVNAKTHKFDEELISALGYPKHLFPELTNPCVKIGGLKKEIADYVGYQTTVVLPATHDTASAVMAVPSTETPLYISSGTWSLLGTESDVVINDEQSRLDNFSNEGVMGYKFRYQKNITGLWMIQSIRKEAGSKYSFPELVNLAKEVSFFPSLIDVNDECFLAPENMTEEVKAYCKRTSQKVPETLGEVLWCVFTGLAYCYAETVRQLERNIGKTFDKLHIFGGGSKNRYLSVLTALYSDKTVITGPDEATALGNVIAQAMCFGDVKDLTEGRKLIKQSFDIGEIKL